MKHDPGIVGKVALVTGVNNPEGIGAAISRALGALGVAVVGTYFRAPYGGDEPSVPGPQRYRYLQSFDARHTVDVVRAAGGRMEAVEADLADPAQPARIFDAAEATFGLVEILVNNAAYSVPDSLLPDALTLGHPSAGGIAIQRFDIDRHDRHFQVNVRAAALLMREFMKRHVARGAGWGRIVSISTDGASGFPSEVSYGASKRALESITRAAAAEFGPYGVTCNVASLGPIQTGYIAPEAQSRIVQDTPLRRVGSPDDVASTVAFLCSDQAGWLTGQLIYVGGGHAMPL